MTRWASTVLAGHGAVEAEVEALVGGLGGHRVDHALGARDVGAVLGGQPDGVLASPRGSPAGADSPVGSSSKAFHSTSTCVAVRELGQRGLEAALADVAPRTDDVGPDLDLHARRNAARPPPSSRRTPPSPGPHQARLVSGDHGLHPVADAELGQHPRHVRLDRALPEHQLRRPARRWTGRGPCSRSTSSSRGVSSSMPGHRRGRRRPPARRRRRAAGAAAPAPAAGPPGRRPGPRR